MTLPHAFVFIGRYFLAMTNNNNIIIINNKWQMIKIFQQRLCCISCWCSRQMWLLILLNLQAPTQFLIFPCAPITPYVYFPHGGGILCIVWNATSPLCGCWLTSCCLMITHCLTHFRCFINICMNGRLIFRVPLILIPTQEIVRP